MNKLARRTFGAALSLYAAGSLLAGAARAQTAPDAAIASQNPQVLERFTVTGSYLPLSASVTPSPVVTIPSSEIAMSGMTDPLQLLKQLTPYFAGNGNLGTESNNGFAGESNVALRNLQTLVLVNGQRMTSSPFSNDEFVDLNIIPTAMIDHIDIVKDSASTVYGSDAIGGVVNVILKKDYNGFEVGGRLGFTGKNDYKTRNLYVIGGVARNGFSLTIGAQHFENTSLVTTDRPLTTLDPAGIAALGYNVSSTVFSGSFAGRVNSLVLAGSPLAIGAPGYNAAIVSPPAKTDPNAAPMTAAQLQAAGYYIPISATPASIASGGSTSILNTTLYNNPLIVDTKRNEFIANAEKELIGKNLVAFGDFMYSQTTNGGNDLAPAPVSGVGPGGGNSLSIPANNPYNLFGITIGVGQPAGAPTVRTRLDEMGMRQAINDTDTWRVVAGLKGAITDRYDWEADFAYSRASLVERLFGGANGANMNTAMQPLIGANGGYVYDANGRPLSRLTDAAGNSLPVYDFFALPGANDPRTIDAIRTTLFRSGTTSLRDISVRVRGTPFELPAGDLSFALGVETRHEELTSSVDGLFANGLALGYNPAKTFPGGGGARSTKGAFIELGVPLLAPKSGVLGFHTLEATLADRQEKIEPGGSANTPKVGLRWLPFNDEFALRGTYAKGFIAPAIYNLFGPSAGNSPSFTLPRGDGRSGAGGSTDQKITIQGTAVELSNPYLQPSHSTSYTAGIVYAPRAIRGLTITADYYSISQDKVGSIDYTAIVADLNAKGSGSVYARDPLQLGTGYVFADGTKLTTTTPNQVNSTNFGTVTVARNPQGDQKTDGLDLSVDYTLHTDHLGVFDFGAHATVVFNFKFRATEANAYLQYARVMTDRTDGGAGYVGLLPAYQINPYVTYTYKRWAASMFMRYIPATTVPGTLFGGARATNDYTINGLASKTPNYFTADLTVAFPLPDYGRRFLRGFTVMAGANNVFNRAAPYVAGDGSFVAENNTVKSVYDIIGRFYFVELKKKF